jgi:hypothetical protein
MSGAWNWWVFVPALIICTIIVQIARGATNRANIARFGPKADYAAEPAAAIIGSIIAGAIIAALITYFFG